MFFLFSSTIQSSDLPTAPLNYFVKTAQVNTCHMEGINALYFYLTHLRPKKKSVVSVTRLTLLMTPTVGILFLLTFLDLF